MKQWLHKLLIATVAFVTFGVISPEHQIWATNHAKNDSGETDLPTQSTNLAIELEDTAYSIDITPNVEQQLIATAKQMSYEKFGSKIGPIIQDEFDTVIFPKIEEVIQQAYENKRKLAISEKSISAIGERIFHIRDLENDKDIIHFHVRKENRPQEGYYFNFHYHLADDNFHTHYSMGDIYWSKNMPPKWLS